MKGILGLIAASFTVVGFFVYFRDCFSKRTKPHAFSWFIWALTGAIAFAAQRFDHAGPGSWVLIGETAGCIVVFLWALKFGERGYVPMDWIALALALSALALWGFTKTPTASVVLLSFVELCSFVPTLRKSIVRPHEETLTTFAVSVPKFGISILALEHYSIATALYPATLVILNTVFVGLILWRRSKHGQAFG
ncbi:hypothetical protein FJZ27_02735 [Candidatus Peribacteria bacterium]|nr:hypothetical protein [Candidatus Peribacteria bacterium]